MQSTNEMQSLPRLIVFDDTQQPCTATVKGNNFILGRSLLAPILAWTTKPPLNEPCLQLAVLTLNHINGLVHILSTSQPWAHRSKTSVSNRRLFLAAPWYTCENVIPKHPTKKNVIRDYILADERVNQAFKPLSSLKKESFVYRSILRF